MKYGVPIGVALLILVGGGGWWLSQRTDRVYDDLKHCKVPAEWASIRDDAWNTASSALEKKGYKKKTKCKKIVIEKGTKMNPATGQWGNSMKTADGDFWYAGLSSASMIKIVATPEGKPYGRSRAIFAHEAGENILSSQGCPWSIDERNRFLWSMGL